MRYHNLIKHLEDIYQVVEKASEKHKTHASNMLDLSRQYGNASEAENNMITGEDDPDLSGMIQAGVDIDDDGDFDPTNLLSQPINFNESIDELDLNINSTHSYIDPMDNGRDSATSDGNRRSGNYYDQEEEKKVDDPRESYFRTPSPDSQRMPNRRQHPDRYDHERNTDRHSPQRHSPHDYEPPPFKDRRSNSARGNPSPKQRRNGPGRNGDRIAEVQQRIRQVQQQIHENMGDDQTSGGVTMRIKNRSHSYRREPSYTRHEDQEHMHSNNYPDEHYYDSPPGERFPPRDSTYHPRHRSLNGLPSGRGDSYEPPRRHSHQEPLQRPHQGAQIMSQNDSGYVPVERRHPMPRDIDRRGYRDEATGPQHQHVLGGMSQSLNESNPMMRPPPQAHPMSQSYNGGMNSSNNSNMPRRGIQSMSESLNGLANPPRMDPSINGMNRSRNGMDHSSNRGIQSMSASLNGMQNMNNSTNGNQNDMMTRKRGIQSMSASLNGMSRSMNGVPGGYGGPAPMNRSMNGSVNGMPNMQRSHNGGNFRHPQQNPMSASQNGMQGGNPLQGMSQSLNGTPSAPYGGHHQSMRNRMPGDHSMQMDGSNNMGMMNRSNNAMGRSMNGSMNASNNGARTMLNNSSVPTAPLLNQVSNLANLPNRGANMMQGAVGPDTTKLSMKLMEAMKRTASSRKLIRDLNIGAMLRGDLKSPASSKDKSVVKAKRKASRQSYTKSQSEAAASREFVKAQKQHEKEEKEVSPQPQQLAA